MAFSRRRMTRIWPSSVRTIDKMIADQVPVKAACSRCGKFQPVDLQKMRDENPRGGDLCLINKRGRCKEPGCPGKVIFLYRRGDNLPFMPLLDADRADYPVG